MRSILYVRLSDNVLEKEDWPIARLMVEAGVITARERVHIGAYSWAGQPDVGWSLERLLEWSRRDYTGQHPELCHEVSIALGGPWSDYCTLEDLQKFVKQGEI